MAHPATLRKLIERYETLRLIHAHQRTPESRRRLEDVSYTLCVTTGTRTVPEALAVAEAQLRAVPPDVRLTA